MPRQKVESVRVRFTVPQDDVSVLEWIESQHRLSESLRLLIKNDIIRNGCTDVTCRAVTQQTRRSVKTQASLEEPVVVVPDTRPKSKPKRVQENHQAVEMPEPVSVPPVMEPDGQAGDDSDLSIMNLFAGHSAGRQSPTKRTASSMGILSDDDDE